MAGLLVPVPAHAADPIAAQTLFDEAKQLMAEGHYTQACPKFAESQKADPGLGTQFHLADCWQHVGRTASAWAAFRDVESQAHARGEASRERVAHDRAAALEPFLSKLAILPPSAPAPPGLTIRRDGVEVGHEQWGVLVPIDPGAHVVAASAPGKQPWDTSVEVPMDGKIATVGIPPRSSVPGTLPGARAPPVAPGRPLAARPASPAYPTNQVNGTPASPRGCRPVRPRRPCSRITAGAQRAVGWFLVGRRGRGGGASGRTSRLSGSTTAIGPIPHCVGNVCDATGSQLRHDATTQGRGVIIAGGAGLVGLIVGGVLAATAPSPALVSRPAARLTVVPIAEAHRGGLGLQGVW